MSGSIFTRKFLDVPRLRQLGWKYKTNLEDGLTKMYKASSEIYKRRKSNV